MRLIDADRLCEDLLKRWDIADKHGEEIIGKVMAYIVTPIVVGQPTIDTQPQWIPVSERLPDKRQEVLITTKNTFEFYTDTDEWDGNSFWCYGETVVAWMPYPEPWKGGKE